MRLLAFLLCIVGAVNAAAHAAWWASGCAIMAGFIVAVFLVRAPIDSR